MKFEYIFAVPMSSEFIHIFRYVDDLDSLEGTLLHADTTSHTKYFRDGRDSWGRPDLNTKCLGFIDRAAFLALLFASLRLALLRIDDCDSMFVFQNVGYILLDLILFLGSKIMPWDLMNW